VGTPAGADMPASSYKTLASQTQLESWAIEGDSPVDESERSAGGFPSSAVHVKYRMNLRGPSRKAKYCS
jgi:hypothetical protein